MSLSCHSDQAGKFASEIAAVEISERGTVTVVSEDEEFKKVKADKVPTLKPAFSKTGTITAANSSKLNDGAAALVRTDCGVTSVQLLLSLLLLLLRWTLLVAAVFVVSIAHVVDPTLGADVRMFLMETRPSLCVEWVPGADVRWSCEGAGH